MLKSRRSFTELIRKNKEELLMDQEQLEKIEKRLDEKYIETNNRMLNKKRKNQGGH